MLAKDLIKKLEQCEPDAKVYLVGEYSSNQCRHVYVQVSFNGVSQEVTLTSAALPHSTIKEI